MAKLDFVEGITLGIIKTLVLIYDIISLPIYFFIQKPWVTMKLSKRTSARFEKPGDPYSSLVGIENTLVSPTKSRTADISHCNTISDIFKTVSTLYKHRRCYGYREVLGEEEEIQPNGKVFRKLILADEYEWADFMEMSDQVDKICKGLLSSGIKSGDRVTIFAETCPEWMLCAQAIFRMGATLVTLYATLGEDGVVHGINQAEVSHVIASFDLVKVLLKKESQLPKLKSIIHMDSPLKKSLKVPVELKSRYEIQSLSQIIVLAERMSDYDMKQRIVPAQPDDTAILMYTSGSTGTPKGVMLSHTNFLAAYNAVSKSVWRDYPIGEHEVFLSYLPLAHILELVAETMMLCEGIPIGYSSGQTMLDTSTAIKKGQKGDIRLLRPTIMPAVPLILDRIRKGIVDNVRKSGHFISELFEFSLDYKKFWYEKGFKTPLADKLIFDNCKRVIGGRMKVMMVGGAPLSPETQEFIRNTLEIRLSQAYGATETAATGCGMDFFDLKLGRVGPPMHGVRVRFCEWKEGSYSPSDKPYPRGEIIIGGGIVAKGYYRLPNETEANFYEEDGIRWWRTGDIGQVFKDGTIKIIDRKKDLVKLQFGEYISLGKVETELKNSEYVDNVCVHGDSFHCNVIALIVPNKTNLTVLAKSMGKGGLSFPEMCQDREIIAEVKKSLTVHATKSGLLKTEIPTAIKLCSDEWIPGNGLVTAALKIRRKQIEDFYRNDINSMYTPNGTQST